MEKQEKIALMGLFLITIPYATNFLSIEIEFLFFIATALLYAIFNIDSRILFLLAILTLAFTPFLVISKSILFAETQAIYVYYLLIVGIFSQIILYFKGTGESFNITQFLKKNYLDTFHIFSLAGLSGFALVYLFNINFLREFILTLGVYSISIMLYGISYLLKHNITQDKKI